jgi:hypothetical protein
MAKYGNDEGRERFMQAVEDGVIRLSESLYDGDIELQDDGRFRYTTNIDVIGVSVSIDAVERYPHD